MNQATVTVRKSKLLIELKKMTKALDALFKRNKNTKIEITITDGLVTLVILGICLELNCETVSTAISKIQLSLSFELICQLFDDDLQSSRNCSVFIPSSLPVISKSSLFMVSNEVSK